MNETPKEDLPENSELDAREEKLRSALQEINQEIAEQKERNEAAKTKWTRREGVYMVIFQTFLVFLMGGVHGSQMRPRSSGRQSMMIDMEGEVHFSFKDFFGGFGEFFSGYPAHFAKVWYVDISLILLMILVAFGVKEVRPRRRYFSMVTTLAVGVLAYYLSTSLPGIGSYR